MNKVLALVLGVILLSVMIAVILGGDDECLDQRGVDGSTAVPPGSYSKPEVMPPGVVTSGYGPRGGGFHYGLDISTAGPEIPIYAFADGVVTNAGPASGFGQWIVISHQAEDGSRFDTVYGHMYPAGVLVSVGDTVYAGQQIAVQGSNGQSSGPHLHFEVHPGGWSQHSGVDPASWVAQAVNPSTGVDLSHRTTVNIDGGDFDGGELPPASAHGVNASEQGLRRDTIRLQRMIAQKFPQITDIGGWRASDPYPDHPDGRALDVMIPAYTTAQGIQLGDSIKDWVYINRQALGVEYVLWRQTSYTGDGVAKPMEDRGSSTANHMDHVHITVASSLYPQADETYTPVDGLSSTGSYTSKPGCVDEGDEHAEHLADGTVPDEFAPWLERGAAVCEAVDAPLLAAQLDHESGFKRGEVSGAGAQGYAQFVPGTWQKYGYAVDDDGNRIGAAGVGDPNRVGDAVMAQAHYMCDIAARVRPKIDSGQLRGVSLTEAMLAGYNAGEGALDTYGGMPPYAETTAYVQTITTNREKYIKH
ncbi:peptidoglycan DD-metalloendopeptidase family protein [Corynebacterium sp. CCM 9203]|uniref:peptidoglycan DD-metalloendopeptidase family protein n=1 Tax=Corynebacterium sp. CCM 9203 TaxID=3057615 RepID=UPI003524E636